MLFVSIIGKMANTKEENEDAECIRNGTEWGRDGERCKKKKKKKKKGKSSGEKERNIENIEITEPARRKTESYSYSLVLTAADCARDGKKHRQPNKAQLL